jgi:hypothetical protein
MNKELSSFAARLRGLIATRQSKSAIRQFPNSRWNCLRFNSGTIPPIGKFARRGADAGVVEHWTQIPAVPTARSRNWNFPAFRRTNARRFHSSGTTEQKPSRHFHSAESLAVYEASLWKWFELNIFDSDSRISIALPDAAAKQAPHSSLVHMFETVRQKSGWGLRPREPDCFLGKLADDGSWTLILTLLRGAAKSPQSAIGNPAIDSRHGIFLCASAGLSGGKNLRFSLPPVRA